MFRELNDQEYKIILKAIKKINIFFDQYPKYKIKINNIKFIICENPYYINEKYIAFTNMKNQIIIKSILLEQKNDIIFPIILHEMWHYHQGRNILIRKLMRKGIVRKLYEYKANKVENIFKKWIKK